MTWTTPTAAPFLFIYFPPGNVFIPAGLVSPPTTTTATPPPPTTTAPLFSLKAKKKLQREFSVVKWKAVDEGIVEVVEEFEIEEVRSKSVWSCWTRCSRCSRSSTRSRWSHESWSYREGRGTRRSSCRLHVKVIESRLDSEVLNFIILYFSFKTNANIIWIDLSYDFNWLDWRRDSNLRTPSAWWPTQPPSRRAKFGEKSTRNNKNWAKDQLSVSKAIKGT